MTETQQNSSLLDNIHDPEDLRKLNLKDLRTVCAELREFLIDSVSKTGGHFGAGLGTVELTVALHYAFQTPKDKLVWDVGHQAYAHKILTGRRGNSAGRWGHLLFWTPWVLMWLILPVR